MGMTLDVTLQIAQLKSVLIWKENKMHHYLPMKKPW